MVSMLSTTAVISMLSMTAVVSMLSTTAVVSMLSTTAVISMVSTTVVDHVFVAWSGQTKHYKMCICCFSARHTALRGKRAKTDWLRIWIMCLSGETSSSFHGNVICSRHA